MMEGHGLDNDIRGWIMSSISGIGMCALILSL